MPKTTAGNKAYHETRRNGGSKEEAKRASVEASENYLNQMHREFIEKHGHESGDISHDSDMHWRDSSDL